jgi:hypothetical protein
MFILRVISAQRKFIFLLALSIAFPIMLKSWHNANDLSKPGLMPESFEARQSRLIEDVKPWCLAGERKVFGDFEMNEVDLQSYCACIVGQVDLNLETEGLDQIHKPRTYPYLTVQLQSFRKRCLQEIK